MGNCRWRLLEDYSPGGTVGKRDGKRGAQTTNPHLLDTFLRADPASSLKAEAGEMRQERESRRKEDGYGRKTIINHSFH